MKIKLLTAFALLGLAVLFTGCFTSVDGRKKAGLPFSKDKITSSYERSVEQVLSAARVVLKHNGQIVSDDIVGLSVTAKVDTRNVWIKARQLDEKVTEVVVQARTRGGRGDVDLASELSKQIGMELAVSR